MHFWTCGFFPGSLHLLLERLVKFPASISPSPTTDTTRLLNQVVALCYTWSDPIRAMATRTNTHDMSFMIQPSMRPRWELRADLNALRTILTAAESLYTRYSPKVGAIRSWDRLSQEGCSIVDMDTHFIVIIDSMCNLDLLYYAAAHTGHKHYAEAATQHARTVLQWNLRAEPAWRRHGYAGTLYSTSHVAIFDPATGLLKEKRTAQGYSGPSTWARGQAWAVLGYAQTFTWTGDEAFLDAACGLAEYFLTRMEAAPEYVDRYLDGIRHVGRYVPLWDFDAPAIASETAAGPLRDASAGVIAANGMLVLSQALRGRGEHDRSRRYLDAAFRIVEDTLTLCLAPEKARLVPEPGEEEAEGGGEGKTSKEYSVEDVEEGRTFEAILKHSTVNYNSMAFKRYWDHGLVYADYYLIEFGNRLLRYGMM